MLKAGKISGSLKVGRDAPGYLLRMPPEMRDELKREALIKDRSMNTVILRRLQESFGHEKKGHRVEQPDRTDYYTMSEMERTLFALLKRLPMEKQVALMTLLK